MIKSLSIVALCSRVYADGFLGELPPAFTNSPATWAKVYYSDSSVAVLSGTFNRTALDAPCEANVSDPTVERANSFLNTTDFIAYDSRFFDLMGPNATVSKIQNLSLAIHEAACFDPTTERLFFVEWGHDPSGHGSVSHYWQYLLNVRTNELRNITTNPVTKNVHGCVFHDGAFHVVTDGSDTETGYLAKIDPLTLESKVLLNNYYEQPFNGFNDVDVDPEGNFYITDGTYGWGRELTPFFPRTQTTVYRVNGTTMRPHPVHISIGNVNGVSYTSTGEGNRGTLYVSDSGISQVNPFAPSWPGTRYNPYDQRGLTAFDISSSGGIPSNMRLFNNPISYFYDGVRTSRNGWVFGGAGGGVDVLDPHTGEALGTIRVGGGTNVAVNMAFGEHEMWIVGKGGVWHVDGVNERLGRDW